MDEVLKYAPDPRRHTFRTHSSRDRLIELFTPQHRTTSLQDAGLVHVLHERVNSRSRVAVLDYSGLQKGVRKLTSSLGRKTLNE